jgi:hypothetical protein
MTRPGAKETGATADLDRVVVEVVIVVGFGVPWAARVSLHRPKAVAVRERAVMRVPRVRIVRQVQVTSAVGPRREGPAGPQGAGRGEYRGGGQGGGERGDYRGGPRFGGQRDAGGRPEDRGPYISPHFNVTFYPEDASFTALAKTIRSSCRTFELFDIAKTVIGKPERFVVVLARKTPEGEAASAAPASKPAPLSLSVPDGLPFENDDAVIAHVLEKHLGLFFDVAEVEVEPPKGNFQVINKCGITGELLGPPNYHRYNQILQQHHAARIKGLSFEAFRSRVESVREPEAVVQWQEKMKKATRYTWKLGNAPAGEGETPAPILFDSFDEARMHLLMNARDKVVRSVDGARFHGMVIANLPPGEIRRAIEGALERQRRFPLDTANALRGRLRRESFTIFKKGSKGISYVCAVKRKFRVPGQTFAETIGNLIAFIEANPMVRAADLPSKLLGISVPPPPATPPVEGASPAPTLTLEEQSRLSRMQGDLRWLVTEGYVTEFIDGRLFAPPAMVEARKKEIENAEHDPENFPDSPGAPSRSSRVRLRRRSLRWRNLRRLSLLRRSNPVRATKRVPPPRPKKRQRAKELERGFFRLRRRRKESGLFWRCGGGARFCSCPVHESPVYVCAV